MGQPFESKEFIEAENWRSLANNKKLEKSECIAVWSDICGYGSLLEKSSWSLDKLQEDGFIELLNWIYTISAHPKLTGVSPSPIEKILIINDGIARTVDLKRKDLLEGHIFLFYFRDILFNHFHLLTTTSSYGVGIRTILAGGERIQYTPEKVTGHSSLYYNDDGKISEFGKRFLATEFTYNPAEFQMNTAFAKAYNIDDLGSNENIKVNGLFIESSYLELISDIKNVKIHNDSERINVFLNDTLVFELEIINTLKKTIVGLQVDIFHIGKFTIHKEFDGDDVECELYEERKK